MHKKLKIIVFLVISTGMMSKISNLNKIRKYKINFDFPPIKIIKNYPEYDDDI